MLNTGTFYTRRNGIGKIRWQKSVQDSEEEGKQVL